MKRTATAAALMLALSACSASGGAKTAVCTITDGDTLSCESGYIKLRLNGVDSPELPTAEGVKASESLHELFRRQGTRRVRYYPLTEDRYGRTVAQVYLNGVDLSCYQLYTNNARYVRAWDEHRLTAAC